MLHDFLSTVDLDGKPISLADYRGKVVLLDFWATWCPPCVAAIPNIKTVYEKYHNKGFDVIGISLDVDEVVLREFIEENPLPWRQIFDGKRLKGPLAQRYGIHSIPRMFLLDREGKVISVGVRSSTLDKLVAEHLEGEVD
ncbi:MAG: TlpA disulfide reductase family protein [Candidatus Poribacteria bacterium]|nr:TlpA disulfide reductase family protein [Candidatus Poribacteria bacterium]